MPPVRQREAKQMDVESGVVIQSIACRREEFV